MRGNNFYILILFLLFCWPVLLDAQVTTANINGEIVDNTGEPLIGATVMAKHTPSGTVYGTTTRDDGRYSLPNLRIGGPYTIEVSYVGYETISQSDIYLKLGQKLPLDLTMGADATTLGEVVVTENRSEVFSNERTGSETNVSLEALEKLPTIGRSASDFTRLTPASDGNSFGGRNDQFNNFSVDGSIFNNLVYEVGRGYARFFFVRLLGLLLFLVSPRLFAPQTILII